MSLLGFLRAGPPPPKVALLPDALFFTRSIPITAGATAAEASAQLELALEAVSPFPLAQLYYGWFWAPGAEHALVFAAYRRRFTSDQVAEWDGAEFVLPTFAAVAGAEVEPATTMVMSSAEGLTAVNWDAPGVPAKVLFRPLPPEASADDRARVREDLLRAIGGSKTVLDVTVPPTATPGASDRSVEFQAGEIVSRLPATAVAAADVRDKAELAALRQARKRDILLWRVTLGCAVALILLLVTELALVGARELWHSVRILKRDKQKPLVEKIQAADALARRIDELATKRLLPFAMMEALAAPDGKRKPDEVWFTSVRCSAANGIYNVIIDGQTSSPAHFSAYENTLKNLASIERVEVRNYQTRGDAATFILDVTFKTDAVKPSNG